MDNDFGPAKSESLEFDPRQIVFSKNAVARVVLCAIK